MQYNTTLNHAFVPGTIPSAVRGASPWTDVTARMPKGMFYGGFEPRLRDLIIEPLVDKQAIDSDSNLTAESIRTDRPGSYRCRKRKDKLLH